MYPFDARLIAKPKYDITVAIAEYSHAVVASFVELSPLDGVGAVGVPENDGDAIGANDAGLILDAYEAANAALFAALLSLAEDSPAFAVAVAAYPAACDTDSEMLDALLAALDADVAALLADVAASLALVCAAAAACAASAPDVKPN